MRCVGGLCCYGCCAPQKRMTQRTNVGVMMAGQGATADVFSATETFLKERRRRAEAQEAASKRRSYSAAQEQARR